MRLITVDKITPGIKLGKAIYNSKGKVLLAAGTELTEGLIRRLKKHKVFTIYIEDPLSEGIEIVQSIPDELRLEAATIITEGLHTIADLATSKVRGMMKSERTIRSFQKIFKDILSCLSDNHMALNLLATTKIHENYLYMHSVNVSIYSCQLAIANGLPLKNIEEIGLGAMLHDLGKVYVSPEILNKPGPLTKSEFDQMKKHCSLGYEVLIKLHEIPTSVAQCAYQHHERIDGTGYPLNLKGNEIHKYAKIISVADVFDAVTSHRVYRPQMLPHKALELLYAGSGTQFDITQVELFRKCIAIYPQGLTVKLNDGRAGIVSSYNFESFGRPVIRIIQDEQNQEVKPYEIDLCMPGQLHLHIVEADALL